MGKEELTTKFPESLMSDIKASATGDMEANERAMNAWEARKHAFFENIVQTDFETVTMTREQLRKVFLNGYNVGWNDCGENIDSLRGNG